MPFAEARAAENKELAAADPDDAEEESDGSEESAERPLDIHLEETVRILGDYIGLLGPTRRRDMLLRDLGLSHVPPRLHGPVGLDLGGESPEEIALEIASQLLAELRRETSDDRHQSLPLTSAV